jgi:outer membrane lipoprotein-sorting protein
MTMSANPPPGSAGGADILSRAVAAIRRTAVPDGPSDETLAQTLAALQAAASAPPITLFPRRRTMFAVLKLAAAVLVAVSGLLYVGGSWLAGASVPFEEIAHKLRDAHTLAYNMTMEVPNLKVPITVRLLFKEPWLARSERVPAGGPVMITNIETGKSLILDPALKTALLVEGKPPGSAHALPKDSAVPALANLRNLVDKTGESVGKKQIGGVETQGYRVTIETGQELTIWADPKTRQPVRIDITTNLAGQTLRGSIIDIEIDPKLDDSLFSLDPPQGYKLQKASLTANDDKDDGTPEIAVAKLLRTYAEKSGGSFPTRLDDWTSYDKQFQKIGIKGATDPELIRLVNLVVRVQIFMLERKGDYGYKSDGFKLGDAEKILFWYKPKGKETYRAVFGDLHVADVTADQLPAVEKPQSQPKP